MFGDFLMAQENVKPPFVVELLDSAARLRPEAETHDRVPVRGKSFCRLCLGHDFE